MKSQENLMVENIQLKLENIQLKEAVSVTVKKGLIDSRKQINYWKNELLQAMKKYKDAKKYFPDKLTLNGAKLEVKISALNLKSARTTLASWKAKI
jgi:hypothetical protein